MGRQAVHRSRASATRAFSPITVPTCAVNANASNPHYEPKRALRVGDQDAATSCSSTCGRSSIRPDAVYYDITWMGFCGSSPARRSERVFNVVRDARDAAIRACRTPVAGKRELRGYEVDDAARAVIRREGFGEYFFHRTGHSIGTDVHGNGANMDNLETHDERNVIPWTCFSVEPGIYLPEFGVRSEVNVYIDESAARVTGEKQESIVLLQ